MLNRKLIGATAMTATLALGGLAGVALGNPLSSGAQEEGSTTTTAPATTGDDTTGGRGHGRGHGRGFDLTVAAGALGITVDELRTALQDGKSLADVATDEGVDKQKVIDALVAAAGERLDEAKAALPERIAELVDRKALGDGGRPGGGHGGPGRGFERGARLAVAAEALGITDDELRTALQDGKSLADVATDEGVDRQKVVDALVAEAKTKLAAAVESGDLTQAEADERTADLADRIAEVVEDTHPGAPGGGRHDRPDGD